MTRTSPFLYLTPCRRDHLSHLINKFHHSSFLNGEPTDCAGELKVDPTPDRGSACAVSIEINTYAFLCFTVVCIGFCTTNCIEGDAQTCIAPVCQVEGGAITVITNKSGHYKPGARGLFSIYTPTLLHVIFDLYLTRPPYYQSRCVFLYIWKHTMSTSKKLNFERSVGWSVSHPSHWSIDLHTSL